jgi:Condensation domain
MRLTIVRLSDDDYEIIWTHHHILLDGWSVSLIIKDVALDYDAICNGTPGVTRHSRPYRDFIGWLQRQHSAEAEAFWRGALKGYTMLTPLSVGGAAVSSPMVRSLKAQLIMPGCRLT